MGSQVDAPVMSLPGLTAEGLRNSLDYLSAFLQGVADGILVQDRDGAILFINDAGDADCAAARQVRLVR
jgi:PAS domain-containing protein